jgi:RimJ/RimL family protein N-acetyltransferase
VDQEGWFERQAKDPSVRMYRIEFGAEKLRETVGVCGLTSLDFANRRAEFSLYIGPEHQQRGFGRRALATLLVHGFQNLGLNLIWGETFEGNHAAKMFESLGFKKEGTRRQFYWKDGRFIDAHLYSITRDEWMATLAPS